ncbi:RidA family protein [uncultured Bosea sp.]|uniref:RidA family protein n=1 Tax=uncultured Bosea sp. TaxID=211457 RepID=UPI0025FDC045|nr:RidA family protein [uncultured Bosea sp.]
MEIKRQNRNSLPHRGDSVSWNGCVHLSGIMPANGDADMTQQTQAVLAEVDLCLAAAGTSKSALISATVWLSNLEHDFTDFNAAWSAWVDKSNLPARSCVGATLNGKGRIEIAVIAACP